MQESTLLPADTPASPSALQESKERMKMTATSGRKCLGLLHRQNPLGLFAKTFMVTSHWDWTRFCLTWKAETTPRNRLLFRLWPAEQTIDGTEFLLWPTPQAMDGMKARPTPAMAQQIINGGRKNRTKLGTMKDAAVYGLQWKGQAVRLGDGELNPQRLEWMMGYPIGWTEIER